MPWIPKGKEIRRLRDLVGWSAALLGERAKLSERHLLKIESDDPPRTIRVDTVGNLAAALTHAIKTAEDRPEELRGVTVIRTKDVAAWEVPKRRRRGRAAPPSTTPEPKYAAAPEPGHASTPEPARAAPPAPALSRAEREQEAKWERAHENTQRTIAKAAAIESAMGKDNDTISVGTETYPLLGVNSFQDFDVCYHDWTGRVFAVTGKITDLQRMTGKVVDALRAGSEKGKGAARFRLDRTISGEINGKPASVPFYATVFTVRAEDGRRMLAAKKDKQTVLVLARVVVKDYDRANGWSGFWFFEGEPHPWPWALVVDQIVSPIDPI